MRHKQTDWSKAHIVIIDGTCRPEVAKYVTAIAKYGYYISYQWFPGLSQNTTGIPSPAIHIYEDELACKNFDKDRKFNYFGIKAVLSILENVAKTLGCQCNSQTLFNYGCSCGNPK